MLVGDIGGPILRNRLWFYGGYAGDLKDIDRTVTFRSTGTTGTFASTEKNHYWTGNLTGQITNALFEVGGQYRRNM